jgi:hypothetical protein
LIISQDAGRPFFMPVRYEVLTNDFERQQPIFIDLADLNGPGTSGMPKNFTDKRGRIVPSLNKYWTQASLAGAINGAPDIE